MTPTAGSVPFRIFGPAEPLSPLIISVPHSGRVYSPALLANARVPNSTLQRLEDRHADLLAQAFVDQGRHNVVIAQAPRALIDLNRDPREIDPAMLSGAPHGMAFHSSAKLRGGLGLIPRRLSGAGDLWRGPIDYSQLQQRLDAVHRPYHAQIESAMAAARAAFGYAILLDIHSMPPLQPSQHGPKAQIVLGDRFGQSASSRLTALAGDYLGGRGLEVSYNHPYPGNYILLRHGDPSRDMHAIQIEIDRSLYLDRALDRPNARVMHYAAMLSGMARAIEDHWDRPNFLQAAE